MKAGNTTYAHIILHMTDGVRVIVYLSAGDEVFIEDALHVRQSMFVRVTVKDNGLQTPYLLDV